MEVGHIEKVIVELNLEIIYKYIPYRYIRNLDEPLSGYVAFKARNASV